MDAAQEIKSRLDVADIVGEYLPLKPAGSGAFKALCPFHHEKTPSFYISRPRQSWHCFGCDQGGDIISFVEKMEGMEFREALELLAQKAGVTLPQYDGEKASLRKRLYEVNDLAVKFFRASLAQLPQAEHARAYVKKRGLDDLTLDLFKLGYAPGEWSALTDALIKRGVTAEELLQTGLVSKRENGSGVYDRFRDRLMFPIADIHGNIVGFTGRILSDTKNPSTGSGRAEAKYVNTPETIIYRKSAVLYGMDKAKGDIRQKNLAIIVEGNMDVIGSHQFGVANVVAASGTALTSEQLALIKRFTTNLSMAFDQDAAGQAATLRGLDLARAQDFSIKIITLPPEAGKDPDDAVRKDPELWKQAIVDAVPIMDWIYRMAFRDQHGHTPDEKKKISQTLLPEIQRIAHPVERDHWLKRLGTDLGVSESALNEALGKLSHKKILTKAFTTPTHNVSANTDKDTTVIKRPEREGERRVFSMIIFHPELWVAAHAAGLQAFEWQEPDLRVLYEALRLRYPSDQSLLAPVSPALKSAIRPPEGLSPDETMLFNGLASFAEQEFESQELDTLQQELASSLVLMRRRRTTQERERLKNEMHEAELIHDEARIREIEKQFESLK
ncbi:DNA primase [Candidatus Uhrbacteria bacterium]|nr:DNA primase [Candidatus Uhrbacteria bacterium]